MVNGSSVSLLISDARSNRLGTGHLVLSSYPLALVFESIAAGGL